jgi:hypothetical protein
VRRRRLSLGQLNLALARGQAAYAQIADVGAALADERDVTPAQLRSKEASNGFS